jgi:hypothetical protein
MNETALHFVPKRKDAIVRQLNGELLVYDTETNKAHCLNSIAADVWNLCDGRRAIAEIIRTIEQRHNSRVSEHVVLIALGQLQKSGLLLNQIPPLAGRNVSSRRAVVRRMGIAAVLIWPTITSILVPTPAEAASPCRHNLQACPQGPQQCCSNLCVVGVCVGG